jgi:uncharacterized protein YjiS (DUF1127 family)
LLKAERAMSVGPARGAFSGSICERAAIAPAVNKRPAEHSALLGRLAAALTARFKKISAALRHRRELEQLARFSDRELRDLAVTRNDIGFALAEPLWRDPAETFRQVRCESAVPISKAKPVTQASRIAKPWATPRRG